MNNKISLVLSGGGARGLAHIGVIEELERQGFDIVSISGTSMGALIGGMYATGKMQEFKEWIQKLDKYEVFKLIDFTLSNQGFIKGTRVFEKMKEFVPDVNIEDLKFDYTATATDLLNAKEVVFKSGSLFEAIRASISIPTVFTPVESHGTLLVDGGVFNNLPISYVKRENDSILIVVDVNADVPIVFNAIERKSENIQESDSDFSHKIKGVHSYFSKFNTFNAESTENSNSNKLNYFDIMDKTTNILADQVSKMVLEKNPPDILVNISRETCLTFDFYKAAELIEVGRQTASIAFDKHRESLIGKRKSNKWFSLIKNRFINV